MLNNLGVVYRDRGELVKAEETFIKAKRFYQHESFGQVRTATISDISHASAST